jgi:hypothetical protein
MALNVIMCKNFDHYCQMGFCLYPFDGFFFRCFITENHIIGSKFWLETDHIVKTNR